MDEWYYLGCYGRIGHYVFLSDRSSGDGHRSNYFSPFTKYDGKLCHKDSTPYIAKLTKENYSALAFWDYTVDTRTGSNSIIFGPGLELTAEELLAGLKEHFPRVFSRFPPITLPKE